MKYLLTNPSSFKGEPLLHVRNQLGHLFLVGFLPVFFFPWLLPFILGLYALWEYVQWRFYGAEDWDCIEDFGHVFAGTLATFSGLVLFVSLIWIASGAVRRASE